MSSSARSWEPRLVGYVVVGLVAGAAYSVFDMLSESRLAHGTLNGILGAAHTAIDRGSPLVVGALLGVCAHYLRLRAQLAAAQEAAARSEALRTRLHKVERDQAVWVLVAAVLHELNNPLHALGLALDELAAGTRSGGPEDAARRDDLIERARTQADRAFAHLRALRGMRSLGEPEVQRIALDRVIASVAHDAGSLAAEDGLVIRTECDVAVGANADPSYVRTIVENLVDNSLHALRAGGGRCVTIRVASEGGHAVVRVCDDGPPVDPSSRDSLFEPLRTTKTHGLGLGLPIARALARAMRGDLRLEDSGAKTFRLDLPLREAP